MAFLAPAGEIGQLGALHRALDLHTYSWSLVLPKATPFGSFGNPKATIVSHASGDELTDPGAVYDYLNDNSPQHVRERLKLLHAGTSAPNRPVASVLDRQRHSPSPHTTLRYVNTEPTHGTIVAIHDAVGFLMASNWKGDQLHTGVVFLIIPSNSIVAVVQKIRDRLGMTGLEDRDVNDNVVATTLMRTFHGQDKTKQIRVHREEHLENLKLLNGGIADVANNQRNYALITFAVAEQPLIDGETRDWITGLLQAPSTIPDDLHSMHTFAFYGAVATYVRAHYMEVVRTFTSKESKPMPETLLNP